ncbi:hypothetical protein RO3G_12112 [Rhizopus delemar RA 99-880]|uniref:HSF-type DNA-binding domain-containing protein n=1 Tax=Rhizopus delemar (strain RA 99-880 / ATCC MYA-4621 / FGSC 9543 / NRRL 43880) TaxID=246409 RepID=I1CG21_RHIO9|nr:hypothetical protein RO3G_12112 [Rhizopus delemar RA 99-880]|eukprot:EIE87401.1 hypothetical protein RO3G_12112 [Rhizopus delemar RA 99-880]
MPNVKQEDDILSPHKLFKSIVPTTLSPSAAANIRTTTPPTQKSVPAFLNKLYSMVNDPTTNDLICWAEDGKSFFVNQQEDFARKVLPRFFKHNKFSSFVRQLNMYGFHKVPHLQQGVLETDSESERWEFSNPNFQRSKPELLVLVTRKKGVSADEKEISNVDLQHILDEIKSIKRHQMNISTQLQTIQRDNQILWQETVQARERHLRHQETIDKILRFLASVFSSNGNNEKRGVIPRKRRFLLGPGNNDLDQETNHLGENAIVTSEDSDDERPMKQQRTEPSFNIDDYVNHQHDLTTDINTSVLNNAPANDLQDAISLNNKSKIAQANPDLLSQLTNESSYGTPPPLSNSLMPSVTSLNVTPPSLNQITNNIANVSDQADALNQDIDDLGLSLQALAQHLGFDSGKDQNGSDSSIANDLLDMDEFLNTYGAEVSTDSTNTDIPSKASTGQSSPIADASINKE